MPLRRPARGRGHGSLPADGHGRVAWPGDPAPARHPEPLGPAGRTDRARSRAHVHLRPDRVPVRPRRQPAQLPPRRPHPPGAAVPRHRRLPRQEHHRRRPPPRRAIRPGRGPDARLGRARGQDAGRDRRGVRGGLPRRRGGRQHPAGPRLPARDRAHPRDGRPGRAARGRRLCLRVVGRQRVLRGRLIRWLWPAVGQLARRAPCRASRRGRARQARPGGLRALEGRRRGSDPEVADAHAGARATRAGTSNARRWRCATSATGSTSTPAASTTSSPTTRTRSRSRRRSSADRRRTTGSTASSCSCPGGRWRSPPATSSA